MASVGGISCDSVKGVAPVLTERVETWVTPGIDGVGAQKLGKSDGDYRFAAVRISAAATVDSWYASMAALQGSVITVVDDWGVSTSNILLLRVSQLIKTPALPYGAKGVVQMEAVKKN